VRFETAEVAPVSKVDDQVNDLRTSLAEVAERLREAAAIGSISDLHAIARELILGDPQQARVGRRIARLVNQFEFDAIERLASGRQVW
jgi:hypothetical protein